MAEIDGDRFDPMATALALSRVVAARRKSGAEPLTFGMTFPFSTHNYQLRFWMAAGGVDPDEDVRLVVLPPPYMVDSLASGQVDAFCVGAPWNSIAVDRGVGHILHFVSDILVRAAEKVLAVRQNWSEKNPEVVAALVRAAFRAAEFIEQPENRAEAARILAQPERIGVDADVIQRTLDGRLKISPDGTMRESSRYLLVGREGARAARSRAGRLALRADGALGTDLVQPRGAHDRQGGVPAGSLRRGARQARSAPPPALGCVRRLRRARVWPDDIAGYLASFAISRRAP